MNLDKSNLKYHLIGNQKYDENEIRKNRLEEEEYNKLVQSLEDMKEIQSNIGELLVGQDEKLELIQDKIYDSEKVIADGLEELKKADELYFSYKAILISIIGGAVISTPLTALIGVKWLGITSGMGGILGGIAGYKFQK